MSNGRSGAQEREIIDTLRHLGAHVLSLHRQLHAIERHRDDHDRILEIVSNMRTTVSKLDSSFKRLMTFRSTKTIQRVRRQKLDDFLRAVRGQTPTAFGFKSEASKSVDDAAKALRTSRGVVLSLLREGKMRGFKVGGEWMVDDGAVDDFKERATCRALENEFVCPRCKSYFKKHRKI